MTKIRILIIDDEPRWIKFVQNDLDLFEIVVATDIPKALAELEEDQFELVIASSRRLEVLEDIAEKYSDKRVIVTTVQPTTQEALTAYRLGAVRYFPKSFERNNLSRQVQEIIPAAKEVG
ncbi:MAG: response regulator transcription factor [Anaerolineae bacterium]|nr:response regulator transcription factor [Anaerolineae bacterium]